MVKSNMGLRSTYSRISRFVSISFDDAFGKLDIGACTVVAISVLAGVSTFLLLPQDTERLKEIFTDYSLESVSAFDSRPQRVAFFIFFFSMLLGALVLVCNPRNIIARFTYRPQVEFTLGIFFTIAILASFGRLREGVVAIPILIVSALLAKNQRMLWSWIAAIIILLVALAVVPGLIGTPVISLHQLRMADTHYAAIFSSVERIADGKQLFRDVDSSYGILVPSLLGIVTKLCCVISLADLTRIVQIAQVICLGSFILAAWQLSRGHPRGGRLLAVLVTTLTVVSQLGTLGQPVWEPTGSGYRFLMIAVGSLGVVYAVSLRPQFYGAIAGALSAIVLLYNLETGIVVSAGLASGWLMRVRLETLGVALRSMLAVILTFVIVLSAFFLLYRTILDTWPISTNPDSVFGAIFWVAIEGYVGRKLEFRPIVIVMMLHAGYILVRAITAFFNRKNAAPNPALVSIATMLLVLLPYYINRPLDWNLWSAAALYSLLLAPLIATAERRIIPLATAAFLLVPVTLNFRSYVIEPLTGGNLLSGWKYGCADGLVLKDTKLCEPLNQRAAVLKQFSETENVVWSTEIPFLMTRKTGLLGQFRSLYLAQMAPTKRSFDEFVVKLRQISPSKFLIDNPDDPFFPSKGGQKFNEKVIEALGSDYCSVGEVKGWLVIERSERCAQRQ